MRLLLRPWRRRPAERRARASVSSSSSPLDERYYGTTLRPGLRCRAARLQQETNNCVTRPFAFRAAPLPPTTNTSSSRSEPPMHRIRLTALAVCALLLFAAAGANGASSDVVVTQLYAG